MEYLGSTLEAIAAEKAGIFKPGVPAVIGEPDPHIRAVLSEHALRAGACSVRVVAEETEVTNLRVGPAGTSFSLDALGERATVITPLIGRHQASNFAFTLALLDAAGPPFRTSLSEATDAVGQLRLPGRFQREGKIIYDVAHNADGARTLAASLASVDAERPVVAVLCVLGDKDWRGMMDALSAVVDGFILTDAPTAPRSRAWSLGEAGRYAQERGYRVTLQPSFDGALRLALAESGTVLITGSFHTVGDAMAALAATPAPG
jgi:dihydrofolate synthase / folylpolyglutamate synthase